MDFQLVNSYSRKRKNWVFLVAALGFSSYGAYRIYHLPSVVKKRNKLFKLLGALVSIAQFVADSADSIGLVSREFNEFIRSESDQIPNSFRQLSKLTLSDEFSGSLTGVTRAFAVGILRGYRTEQARNEESVSSGCGGSSLADKVLDKLFSTAGSGFASVVVGSFARNLVMGFYSNARVNGYANSDGFDMESDSVSRWIDIVCDEKCKNLIADCIQVFVSTAVAAYLDKTMDINTYEEMFRGLTNPKHETQVREMLVSLCNGAIETFVKTSHQVLTTANKEVDSNSSSSGLSIHRRDGWTNSSSMRHIDGREESEPTESARMRPSYENQDTGSGWMDKMSSTLAVPSNRRFVLDMTGRVTFETVRSFLEFLLQKLSEGLRNNFNVVHDEVVDRGIEAFRYVTAKSSTIATICLSLCLHILNGPWIFVPA